jgi:tungstate transport system substrate-binding protein
MKRSFIAISLITIAALLWLPWHLSSAAAESLDAKYGTGPNFFSLATGSPGELGLLQVMAEAFAARHNATMGWRKAGSGESLKLLKEKAVDMVMVHAPSAEKQAVAEGWAVKRELIGSNEFYIVGPTADPAGIASAKSAAEAYAKIAAAKALFFSRGDNSGTHKKELAVWQKTGDQPVGDWYVVTKTFMMATLEQANARQGYFMTDSSTWVAAKQQMPNLKILFRGDPFLINTYHTLCQPAGATPGQSLAAAFVDFVVSDEGQALIRDYGAAQYGEGLYNDAAYAQQYDH